MRAFVGDLWFLSNFSASPLEFEGLVYTTVEHGFAAAKTLDQQARERIRLAVSPGAAKALGRQVQLRPDWETIKTQVMRNLLVAKFANPGLRAQLLATNDRELVESNDWHDVIWGRCECSRHQGKGETRLGTLLMEIRASLQSVPKENGLR